MRVVGLAALVSVVGCAGAASNQPPTAPGLSSDVELVPPRTMTTYCDLDPEALCKDFVEVPHGAVEAFELRLEDRLTQRNLACLTPVITVPDTGDCGISVQFYADKPQSLEAEAAGHRFEAPSDAH